MKICWYGQYTRDGKTLKLIFAKSFTFTESLFPDTQIAEVYEIVDSLKKVVQIKAFWKKKNGFHSTTDTDCNITRCLLSYG